MSTDHQVLEGRSCRFARAVADSPGGCEGEAGEVWSHCRPGSPSEPSHQWSAPDCSQTTTLTETRTNNNQCSLLWSHSTITVTQIITTIIPDAYRTLKVVFRKFPGPFMSIFHDFTGLENLNFKLHDFPQDSGCPLCQEEDDTTVHLIA